VKAAVIYNPSAGRGRGSTVASAVERGLADRGFEVGLHATRSCEDATEIAHRLVPLVDVIVAVGGDGTVNEVVNGMTGGDAVAAGMDATTGGGAPGTEAAGDTSAGDSPRTEAAAAGRPRGRPRTRLGIVPAGTVNVLARELGLPFEVERACVVIAGGKTLSLDLGRVNGRRFVLMMGAGVDALTVRNIDRRAKRFFRELAFVGTGIWHGFAAAPSPFLVRMDDRTYRATFLVAGNSRYYARGLGVTPSADLTDGLLDLMIFTGTTRRSLAVFWLEVLGGRHLRDPHVTYIRAASADLIPVNAEDTIWMQTDGEPAGRLPARIEVDRHALEVLVP
jgi:diacylglycerol kinase (ATP)